MTERVRSFLLPFLWPPRQYAPSRTFTECPSIVSCGILAPNGRALAAIILISQGPCPVHHAPTDGATPVAFGPNLTASSRQTSKQDPQLMHFSGSITCFCFGGPLIAPDGQTFVW